MSETEIDRLEKWRLILGGGEADGTACSLSPDLQNMDLALAALYDFEKKGAFEYGEKKGRGGQGASNPGVALWLGDIRKYFPNSVVQVLQDDAMQHPVLKEKILLEPDILEKAHADVHLVANLMQLGKLIPSKTKETARKVVAKVVDELLQKLEQKTLSTLRGVLDKSSRKSHPRQNEIDWKATIRKNLRHYLPEYRSLIPETLVGYGSKSRRTLHDVILCLDQSGSMGSSVVYSGIFGAVMSSLPQVKTKMVVFDTQVADLSEDLKDPVDLLFGVQLGGGTDINLALGYCQELVSEPSKTVLVLITDLYEGGDEKAMLKKAEELVSSGVQVICLLALNDDGAPSYDMANAKRLTAMGIPVFACTPDLFPEMMAAALQKQDLRQWAGDRDIVAK